MNTKPAQSAPPSLPEAIFLHGAHGHNLKGIDVRIPLGRLSVVTGPSGSGKRSLVFCTLGAEAGRRYGQAVSAERDVLDVGLHPAVNEIGPIPPVVAIGRAHFPPHANVGSLTDLGYRMRQAFARSGVIVCPACGTSVRASRHDDVLAAIHTFPVGTRCAIAFPAIRPPDVPQADWLASLLEEGYVRIQVGQVIHRLGEPSIPELRADIPVWVLVDRFESGKTPAERMQESIAAAFRRGHGRSALLSEQAERVFDLRNECVRCNRTFPDLEPRLFEMCSQCQGEPSCDPCPACQGRRWSTDALAVRVQDRNIADCYSLPLRELRAMIGRDMEASTSSMRNEEVDNIAGVTSQLLISRSSFLVSPENKNIHRHLAALDDLGLGHLSLGQPAASLGEGALRRIGLAAALGSGLVQVLYLIAEPTVGLHAADVGKLTDALHRLRDQGNTVVVIDNDCDVIAVADHVIELGPGGGDDGGKITFQGAPANVPARASIPAPAPRPKPARSISIIGAGAGVEIPLGVLVVVTGARANDWMERFLYPALCQATQKKGAEDAPSNVTVAGAEKIADVVLLGRELFPRGRNNPATHLKFFDDIRGLFADSGDAKARGFGPGDFSFNQVGARCDTCEGHGSIVMATPSLPDLAASCPACRGRRYRKEILEIAVRQRSIADVLDLTLREAFRCFHAQPAIEKKLKLLIDVGLGYLRLGQPLDSLNGGECQRMRLASHLNSSKKASCLFLLIEPAACLHPTDLATLFACYDRLLAAGHSLIAVEHQRDAIARADWVIEPTGDYEQVRRIR